jgi:flagellin
MIMISINTNVGGLFAAKASQQSTGLVNQAMERLSTGKRINSASDDAAGSAIAIRLTAEIQGLSAASRNASDGQSMVDTAEGALQETSALLLRMRELAVQAANSTATAADKTSLDAEFQHLSDEIGRIASNTSWSGQKLLDGSFSGGTAAVIHAGTGSAAGDQISITMNVMSDASLSVDALSLSGASHAVSSIAQVDLAIAKVSDERNKLGAVSNRLTSTVNNLDQIKVNLSASRGRIEDADFAQETGNLAKGQILQQAATAMLAQANASKQTVLTLIR